MSLEQNEAGTRVSESFQVISMPRPMEWLLWLAMPAHRDRTSDLAEDLARLKVAVESGGVDTTSGGEKRSGNDAPE